MFVGVVNFGHVQALRFVSVNIFQSKSNQNLVILIRSCELALIILNFFSKRPKRPSIVEVVQKFELLIERSRCRTWSVVDASTCHLSDYG